LAILERSGDSPHEQVPKPSDQREALALRLGATADKSPLARPGERLVELGVERG
jgi:hypothetical protein